jgi:lipopolysaccharide biosynthesis glycosyltransferase
MKTAIVVASDENYLPAACCALLSCVQAGRATGQTEMFLIADQVPPSILNEVRRFLMDHKIPARIIDRCIEYPAYRADRWVSLAGYVRLHLDDYFDRSWSRVLYLDADTRVKVPLQPLLEMNLRGRVLGAVDHAMENRDHVSRLSMADDAPCLNSGVLLFDWPAVLSLGLLGQARRFAFENPSLCIYHDQDALNKVFEGLWTPIDLRWNLLRTFIQRLPRCRPYILHYTEPGKPWSSTKQPYWLADALWYRRILRNSPWPDFAKAISFGDVLKAARYQFQIYASHPPPFRLSADGLRADLVTPLPAANLFSAMRASLRQ